MVYSEMVSAKGLYYNGARTQDLLRHSVEEKPIAFQLFGSEPAMIEYAVRELADHEHELIDINMGCPVPKVVQNGDGAALMKDPGLAAELVRRAVETEDENSRRLGRPARPVTVKCRSGWDARPYDLIGFARRIEEAGAAALAIHGRTREQYYSGKADWEAIARLRQALNIPVIGSGDVLSGSAAVAMIAQTGCDYVMIARGALGNPWIFKEAGDMYEAAQRHCQLENFIPTEQTTRRARPAAEEVRSVIDRQLAWAIEEAGEKRAVPEMRKHIGWYLKGWPGAAAAREKINRAANLTELKQALAATPLTRRTKFRDFSD